MGSSIIMDVSHENFPFPRLGLTVSKQFGDAHLRNKFKRRVREAFRRQQFPAGLVLHVSPKNKILPTFQQIVEDFKHAE